MIESEETAEQVGLNKAWLAAAAMATCGLLAGFAAVVWAAARYVELVQAGEFSVTSFLETTALMLAGVGLGLLLWGGAELLRRLHAVAEALRALPRGPATDAAFDRMPSRSELSLKLSDELKMSLAELVGLTREVRDISLLSESERTTRLQVQGRALVQELQERIPALLQEHRWVEARQRVQQARERFPAFAEWDELEQRIETMRANVEAHDVEAATRQVEDLAALGALDRAITVVRELLDRHPNSAKAQELVRRVTLWREKADAERRARMMAQAQEAVNRREWNRALSIANELLRRYPRTPEGEALRQQLPTLTENAEIQTRQQMESQFRELMRQRRPEAALRLAHELIERYPNSPQAEALRAQLPRLEEKATLR